MRAELFVSLHSQNLAQLAATAGAGEWDSCLSRDLALRRRDAEGALPRECEAWTEFHGVTVAVVVFIGFASYMGSIYSY